MATLNQRLAREINVWASLKHPNITPFLGVIDGFGPLWAMVSPLYKKSNINQYILDNPEKDRLSLPVLY